MVMNINRMSEFSAIKSTRCCLVFTTALLVAVAQLAGCASRVDEINQLDDMGAADIHRVKSEQLQLIMRRMNSIIYERETTALDIDEERMRRAGDIAELLSKMSQEIADFAKTQTGTRLDKDEIEIFNQYVSELGGHGKAINEIAASERAKEFMPAMNKVVQTCNACHDRFRSM